jgi:hypothetical protein
MIRNSLSYLLHTFAQLIWNKDFLARQSEGNTHNATDQNKIKKSFIPGRCRKSVVFCSETEVYYQNIATRQWVIINKKKIC